MFFFNILNGKGIEKNLGMNYIRKSLHRISSIKKVDDDKEFKLINGIVQYFATYVTYLLYISIIYTFFYNNEN